MASDSKLILKSYELIRLLRYFVPRNDRTKCNIIFIKPALLPYIFFLLP